MTNYFSFAKRNLKRRGIRSWLTLIGIFIGVTAVVSLISLSSGLKIAVNSQFGVSSTQIITVQAGGLTLGPPGSGVAKPLERDLVEKIEDVNSVEYAIARNIENIKVEYNDVTNYLYAMSVPEKEQKEFYEIMDFETAEGKFIYDNTREVFLGNNYAKKNNGFDKKIGTGDKLKINNKSFEVSGIMKKEGSFIFDNVIGMSEKELDKLFPGNKDIVDAIAVKVKNKDLIDKAKQDIEELLREERGVDKGGEDFKVETPEASLDQVNQILNGIQIFIIIVASISIIIGSIGIINTMTTSVLERKKEIGIMKAIGAKNSEIFNMFLVESGLLGLVGGIVGIIIGETIGYFGTIGINNFFGSSASPEINFVLIIGSLVGSFLIGAIAGISPALKAAKQDPVNAIRG
ncbi:MAG TPA: ABC transporter permease [Candidatus Nanoarchaeia archaeon]|nr:ABC transporter permease [Candidatus Nanoarchaeia archaeon]